MTTADAQDEYRRVAKEYEQIAARLRAARAVQRIYWIMVLAGSALTLLLGYSVVVGLWREKPEITRYVGLLAVTVLLAAFGFLAWKNRITIVQLDLDTRNLLYDKQVAVSAIALESVESLKIYREASLDLIEDFRRRAKRNRRVHNIFQAAVIIGSIIASTAAALDGPSSPAAWVGVSFSTLVSISAGIAAYFKFRERGHNLQSTADELEKHHTAAEFGLDEYAELENEMERLRLFAKLVERIKDEQRKRELQLEQSPSSKDGQG